MAINIIADKCKACGICVRECPFEAMSMSEAGGKKVVSATETIGEVEYTVYTLDKKRPMVIMVF